MNCEFCKEHIVATMQISWRGYNYHQDCVGEAVAQHRAEQERINNGVPPEFEPYLDEEPFDDEYAVYEENDDLEDVIERLDEMPEVSDEVLNQIAVASSNGHERHVIIPEVVNEAHIQDIVRNVGNQFAAERSNGTLMAHCGTVKVDRHFLSQIELPNATDTFQPIAHSALVDAIEESLSYRRIRLVRSEFAVSKDGMKMFGLLEVNHELDGIRFAIGLRNANDKSMRLGMVAGYRVFVCDNMSLAGDFKPLLAKHTKKLDLIESVSMGIDRIQRSWQPLSEAIKLKKETKLCTENSKLFIYKAFTEGKIPISLFRTVHQNYFDAEEQRTVWGIENAFTDSFKKLLPVSQFENTAKLGRLITAHDFA